MARPRKEGLDYFPHDTDASSDEKVDSMRALFGNDGYTFYFYLCERIYRTSTAELDLSKYVLIAPIIKKLLVDRERFEEMLDAAFELNLFSRTDYEERGVLTSSGIKKRFREVSQMREKWRKNKQNPAENGVFHKENAVDNTVENDEVTGESKAKESKVNEIKENTLIDTTTEPVYESFYSAHQRIFGFQCNPFQANALGQYIDKDGMEEVVVIRALERAAHHKASYSFDFIVGILNNYANSKALTLDQAIAIDEEFERRKKLRQMNPQRGSGQASKPRNPLPPVPQATQVSPERLEQIRKKAAAMDEKLNKPKAAEV